jgi:hypothetical protein
MITIMPFIITYDALSSKLQREKNTMLFGIY